MKKIFTLFCALITFSSFAQQVKVPVDTTVVTNHSVTIKGKNINYSAQTGMQPVWDDQGNPIASLYYTYYKRSDIKNTENRPLVISFNGGPGSASVWMHIAYTGPRILKIDDEGYPVQPYGIKENPYSILDVADIVYVNPVNTGYSRPIPDADGKVDKSKFFGSQNINIGGNNISLDNIEHGILRGSQFKYGMGYIKKLWAPSFEQRFMLKDLDYRIHFTMNCGATSCPAIAFYKPEHIDEQLDLAESVFMNANSEYNAADNTVEVSQILQWFKGDFGGDKGIINILMKNNIIPDNSKPDITYKEYDWTLESKKYD